jgi:uncharacterized delta-60 repeat protein
VARVVAISLLLAAGAATRGLALPGGLDPTFAGLPNASVGENVTCHAVAPDGKIVLAGSTSGVVVVSRRLPNGAADPDFGTGGTFTYGLRPMDVRSVAVQANGKIIVAGPSESQGELVVLRLTAGGERDLTFDDDGFAYGWSGVSQSYLGGKVLIQPDGKIVLVGSAQIGGDWDFIAFRFNTNGTPDGSFGFGSSVTIGFGGNEECHDATFQADGKLIMVGGSEDGLFLDQDFAIARLYPDGSLDNSFDGDGKVTTGFSDQEEAYAVAIQPSDLRIVVAGRNHVARYHSSDGSLDGSFDGDGKLSIPIVAFDAAVTPGGKITLIGVAGTDARALRLNSNGSLDPEWQGDGDVIVDENVDNQEPPSLSLLADGRVLTVVPKGGDCWLRRYWADGYLDDPGRQVAAFDDATFPPGSREVAHDMAIQVDGKILLAGEVSTAGYTETDFALVRFLPDGRLDASFGVLGRASVSLGNYDVAKAVAIQPDGRIVVAGYTGSGNAVNFMIARFHPNGTLDNTFGFGGYNVMDFMGGPDYGWAIALLPDGRIVVAGTVFNGARNVFGVACFRNDGTADTAFDIDGKQLYEFSLGPTHWASAVLVQSGNRILVGGHVGADFALVAFTLTGGVDPTFGTSGRLTRNLGGDDYLEALAIGGGMIYAGGTRVIGGNADFALARWTSNGAVLWCPFGCSNTWTDERAFVDFGATSGWVNSLDVRGDGQIVAGGTVGTTARWAQFSPTSSTLVAGGFVSFPGNATAGLAVRFTGANKVVLAGSHTFQGDQNMTVARFETIPNPTVAVDEPTWTGPSLRLAAPFPNPLVGRSTFTFDLPRRQSVRLAIYDASGRQVRMLMNGELAEGRHHRLWDGTDDQGRSVAAGVYFGRLAAGADHAAASIVVLR